MRRVLVDHARSKGRGKRGGDHQRVKWTDELILSRHSDEDVLLVDEALQQLAALDPRQASIVEMRFISGMTIEEIADMLNALE